MIDVILAALVTITGVVTDISREPLPGVTVTLTRGAVSHDAITDIHGRYTFAGVEDATWDLRAELSGFGSTEARVREGGEVPPVRIHANIEAITLSCGSTPCSSEPPARPYDLPHCADYELNTALIDARERGDASAAALLRARYAQTVSHVERHRIGAALLDHEPVWSELASEAELCVRFPDNEAPAYQQWCAERGLSSPGDQWWTSYDAFLAIAADPRARPLLRRALESEERNLVDLAIMGLAIQRDEASLPAIDRALARFPKEAWMMVEQLEPFGTPAAQEIARKYEP